MIEWKQIDGPYLVSSKGDIKSLRTGKIMKPGKNSHGYFLIQFRVNGETKQSKIHRLVASAFIPNPENKPIINHINGDKLDNRVENLEWSTKSENALHAYRTGLHGGKRKSVAQYDLNNNLIQVYQRIKDAAIASGANRQDISKVCKGKRNSSGGFIWRYV